ncbi:MAG TPA: hypothetical protein VM366_18165 [Anaerolineae bacterium]|nr:hypothetical protein [Anaerolineae bacterium]
MSKAIEISDSAALPIAPVLEIVAAARARGRAREPEPTVQELLTAL